MHSGGVQRITPENWAEGADVPPHTPLPGVLLDAAKLRGSEGMGVMVPGTSTGGELDTEMAATEELAEMAEDQEGIDEDPEWAQQLRGGSTQWCIVGGGKISVYVML